MVFRCYLAHDGSMSRPNVWRLADDGRGVVVRIRIASGPEHTPSLSFEELALRAHDDDTFVSVPLRLPEMLGRIEIVLRGAPEEIAAIVREAMRPEGA